jgi:phosphate transport system permease protein
VTSATHDEAPAFETEALESGRLPWRVGDIVFYALTAGASLATVALVAWLGVKVIAQAWGAIEQFGLSFIWTVAWDPVTQQFGALDFIFGTAVTAFIALLIATPLSIGIALFLTELAPRWLRGPVGTLIELLAAIPSVILGLWGILVFGPWVAQHLEPWLADKLGFIPIFDGAPSPAGLLPAALVLTLMIVPITSSICRELFSRVPRDLSDGAMALGATRWETIRGVSIPYAGPGIVAAVLLGLGRAFGEAIAVTQVIGGGFGFPDSIFGASDTLASRIASEYQGAVTGLQIDSLLYLAAILLVISLLTNVAAQSVVRRFERTRGKIA